MNKKNAIVIAVIIGIIAITAPILISLYLARQQSFNEQSNKVISIADEVLRRSEKIGEQADAAIKELEDAGATDPCSDENIRLMRALDMKSDQLQTLGYIEDDRVMCSAYGPSIARTSLGPPDYLSEMGVYVRIGVSFPSTGEMKFLIFTRKKSGYSALIHPGLPIDIFKNDPEISLGVFGFTVGKLMTSRGAFEHRWVQALGNRYHAEIVEHGRLVAIRRSKKYDIAAYASVPAARVEEGIVNFAVVLVPVGIIAGIILALTVLYMARQQLSLAAALKTALRRNEFFLVYQPVVDLKTGNWVGAESLIRWQRSNGEMVRPDLFIPVAEDTGFIQRITERVIELAAGDAARLFKSNPDFNIGINLSSTDLHSRKTIDLLNGFARQTNALPNNLVVEITERSFLDPEIARDVVRELRGNNIRVSIDDFGTGYSSLSYLETLELDFLKIDKSFVGTIETEAATSQVILHIIEMAKALNLEMVAEGVETEEQAQFLRERGVKYAQGWLFSKPMIFSELMVNLEDKEKQV